MASGRRVSCWMVLLFPLGVACTEGGGGNGSSSGGGSTATSQDGSGSSTSLPGSSSAASGSSASQGQSTSGPAPSSSAEAASSGAASGTEPSSTSAEPVLSSSAVSLGPPSATRSLVTADPDRLVADGVAQSTLTVTARDRDGNPLPGVTVELSVEGLSNTVVQPDGPSNQDGVAVGRVSSTYAETKRVYATLNPGAGGVNLAVRLFVHFQAGPLNLASSTLEASPVSLLANGSDRSTLGVHAVDAHGNPIAGVVVALEVSGTNNTLEPATVTTGADGKASATLASTTPETKTVSATVDGAPLGVPVSVTFRDLPDAGPCAPLDPAAIPVPELEGDGYTLALYGGTPAPTSHQGLVRALALYSNEPPRVADVMICNGDWENPNIVVGVSGHVFSWRYDNPADEPHTGSWVGLYVVPASNELRLRINEEIRVQERIRIWGFRVDRINYSNGSWWTGGGAQNPVFLATHFCMDGSSP